MSTAIIIMGLVYAIIAWVLYHKIFEVVYFDLKEGCMGEIIGSLVFGYLLAGLTMYFWKISVVIVMVACIIAILCCNTAESKALIVVAGIILIIIIVIMGINFKKSMKEKQDSTAAVNQEYLTNLEVDNDYRF